ncbi:hypothetical protein ACN99C_17715 [Pseudomonas alloputida]|uniref:hypothetical protein n=1 Tax=Pseudomonas putida group TaxID=136845 RepID=UPI003524855A
MTSVVTICNMALANIGHGQQIEALTEGSNEAQQCNLFYEHCRDTALQDYRWGFSTAYAALAKVADNPDPEFPYAFGIPVGCLKVWRIINQAMPAALLHSQGCVGVPEIPPTPYRIINGGGVRLLAAPVLTPTIEYTVRVTSSELFDPLFVSALSWLLASKIVGPLAKDPGIVTACLQQYRAEITNAAASDLNQSETNYVRESAFITVR